MPTRWLHLGVEYERQYWVELEPVNRGHARIMSFWWIMLVGVQPHPHASMRQRCVPSLA